MKQEIASVKELGASSGYGNLFAYEGLDKLFSFSSLLELTLSVSLLFLLFWFSNFAIKFLWRLGIDPEHRLRALRKGIRISAVVWVALWVSSKAIASLPILSVVMLTLVFGGAIYVSIEPLQSVAAALAFFLRKKVKLGDQITIGGVTGEVQALDLLHLTLKRKDGSLAWLPNRMLYSEGMILEAKWNAVPVEVILSGEDFRFSGRSLSQLKDILILSPYRTPGSSVDVVEDKEDVRVKLITWSSEIKEAAEEHVLRTAQRYLNSHS